MQVGSFVQSNPENVGRSDLCRWRSRVRFARLGRFYKVKLKRYVGGLVMVNFMLIHL